MTGAEALIESLLQEQVEHIFGYAGATICPAVDALKAHPEIGYTLVRTEQNAGHAASGYARISGKPGVCMVTSGPGATNLITGVADAYSDGAPLVAITGQVGTERMHITSHQFLDLTKMFEPITKRTKMVVRPDTIGEIVRLAFKYAENEKPGATHIDLPVNIAKMPVPEHEKPLKKKI